MAKEAAAPESPVAAYKRPRKMPMKPARMTTQKSPLLKDLKAKEAKLEAAKAELARLKAEKAKLVESKAKVAKKSVTDEKSEPAKKRVSKANEDKPYKGPKPTYNAMVQEAIQQLPKRKGITLNAIRKYLNTKYNCATGSRFNLLVRQAVEMEWQVGAIKHFDDDEEEINFKKRFAISKSEATS